MHKMYKINGNPQQFPDLDVFHKLSQQFLPYAQKRLGFDKPVGINLISDPQNAKNPLGKTAYYDPNQLEVTVFVDKRHVKDILRSMSHELVHHTQNCRGEFDGGVQTGPGYAQEDGHMREMEKEAYLEGQMLLRDFEDNLKKENQQMSRVNEAAKPDYIDLDGDGDKEESMKKAAADKKKKGKAVDEAHCPSGKRDDDETLDEDIFAPNHYCVHHGGVQMEGKVKLGTVIGHNWSNKLGRVTKYDMQFADGTIVEGVKAEDILVTEASLANEHAGHSAKRDNDREKQMKAMYKKDKQIDKLKPVRGKKQADQMLKTVSTAAKEADKANPEMDEALEEPGKLVVGDDPTEKGAEGEKKKKDKKKKDKEKKDQDVTMENWTRKNKDQLLFERLTKMWTK